ncbi:MAG: hypothetical protein A3G25_16245 [Betaproteobacteria bacterium RIFCSPLOWO2_12_FULL_63_13]|nr:MAG: hypothetical protein A3G25_16245 [Betaproteobacteria bacterium RIFCSPLOWO2_12_FULL_63_13]
MRLIVIGGLFLLGWASTARAAIPASERQALLDLYTSTNGKGWTNSTSWNGAEGTECTWYGVTCDGTQGHVDAIDLQQNNLVGTLPSLGALTAMVHFETGANQLSGSIPSLSGMTALTHFGVRGNLLSGSIPSLSGLTALVVFSVHDNQLTGNIPSLDGLTSLQIFYVDNNQLTGPVPAPPTTLAAGGARLCGNDLVSSGDAGIDAAWTTATGIDWLACQATAAVLTVKIDGTGFGDIASDPTGISCYNPIPGYAYFAAPDCSETYASGASVTLTATPAAGSTFAGWGTECTGTGPCTVSMDKAKTVSAKFESDQPIVGDPTKPVAQPPVVQTSYLVTDGAMADDAAKANVEGTLGKATVTVQLDLSKVLPASFAADTSYNVYVAALVPGRQIGSDVDAWFVKTKTADVDTWRELASPIASYLQNVASGSVDQQILIEIVSDTDITTLIGTEVYIGYGTSDTEMLEARRYRGVFIVE